MKNKYKNIKIMLETSDGDVESDNLKCAEILNSHFSSVFTKGPSILPDFNVEHSAGSMQDPTFDAANIVKKINDLNIHKAGEPDEIPSVMLKIFSDLFAPILCKFFKKSHIDGIVPRGEMKQANVIPIFKSEKRTDPNNYRPISLTPIIAKIFESIFYDSLVTLIEDNRLFTDVQHSFRRNRSTNSNMLQFWNDVTSYANDGRAITIV